MTKKQKKNNSSLNKGDQPLTTGDVNKTTKNGSKPKNGKSSKTRKNTKICLCMIVKNESKIMIRCLNSALKAIDYVSILDTGNPEAKDWDNGKTKDLIVKWGKTKNIPTKVHNEPFVNFSVSRSRSAALAMESFPDADYLLMIDADMVLEVKDTFKKSSLTLDSYTIKQYSSSVEYWNIRLVSTRLNWTARAVTHEYWEGKRKPIKDLTFVDDDEKFLYEQITKSGHVGQAQFNDLVIDDREDGGCKDDKFIRDERLLRGGLKDPSDKDNHTRYKFYLAQTLRSLGKYQESNEWYRKRIDSGGWYEELFYSHFQIARNYRSLYEGSKNMVTRLEKEFNKIKSGQKILESLSSKTAEFDCDMKYIVERNTKTINAFNERLERLRKNRDGYRALMSQWYIEAWDSNTKRVDALYEYINILRKSGKQRMSLLYALEAKNVPFPSDQKIFIDPKVWEYKLDVEIVICAYYVVKHRKHGVDAIKRIRSFNKKNPGRIPKAVMKNVEDNAKFYKNAGLSV